jgi:exodeoxyribonuclease-3
MFNKEPRQYTWWDYKTAARERNVGWRLDYFIVDEACAKKVRNAYILGEARGSDHAPVGIDSD